MDKVARKIAKERVKKDQYFVSYHYNPLSEQ